MFRGYVDLGWGQMHYRAEAADSGLPMMIMLHQSPLSSCRYDRVLPLLSSVTRPVALDTPGFGYSDHPESEWPLEQFASNVWRVVDSFGGDRVIIFGRATGAVIGVAASLLASERTLGLILHGYPLYTDEERAERLRDFAPPFQVDPNGSHLSWIWRRIYEQYPGLDEQLASSIVEDYLAAGPDYACAYRAIWNYDCRSALAAVNVPTLLLCGTRDRIVGLHERAVAMLNHASAVTLPGANDFVAEQEPDRFARAVLPFVESLSVCSPGQ